MSGWYCPNCGRLFAHRDQPHSCIPSNVRDALEKVKPALRPLLDELIALVSDLTNVKIEHASGSFMAKAPATFCSFRPRAKDVQVSFILGEKLAVFPISKSMRLSTNRVAHAVHVDEMSTVDEQLRSWIREAHRLSTSRSRRSTD